MTLTLDHIVIAVDNLPTAVEAWEQAGFTVTAGGEHPAFGSRNALIPLADDSYLELIAFPGERSPGHGAADARVRAWRQQRGLADVALLPRQIETTIGAARARGLPLAGPVGGQRVRPDGQEVAWQFAFPDGRDLPFLCADLTPRERRVPPGTAREHPNGVRGVAKLIIAVRDLVAAARRYESLLGVLGLESSEDPLPATQLLHFPLGTATLVLAAPLNASSPVYEQLTTSGEGPYSLFLRSDTVSAPRSLDRQALSGARVTLLPA